MTASFDGPVARQNTLPGLGVEPRSLEMHALVLLDCEVTLMRLGELWCGDPEEPRMNVHKLHDANSCGALPLPATPRLAADSPAGHRSTNRCPAIRTDGFPPAAQG